MEIDWYFHDPMWCWNRRASLSRSKHSHHTQTVLGCTHFFEFKIWIDFALAYWAVTTIWLDATVWFLSFSAPDIRARMAAASHKSIDTNVVVFSIVICWHMCLKTNSVYSPSTYYAWSSSRGCRESPCDTFSMVHLGDMERNPQYLVPVCVVLRIDLCTHDVPT